jgi:hypothetical protein
MVGFITIPDLKEADDAFPGISRFFESLSRKPRTFLELVWRFEHWRERAERSARLRSIGQRTFPELGGDDRRRRAITA